MSFLNTNFHLYRSLEIIYKTRLINYVKCGKLFSTFALNRRLNSPSSLTSTSSQLCNSQFIVKPIGNFDANNCTQIRYKSNKKGGEKKSIKDADSGGESDDDSDADMEEFNEAGIKDRNLIKIKVQSMRLDLLIKSTLRTSRNKIEKIFFESKIRVNGKKVSKKSISIREGDEVDVIKGFHPTNPENLLVSRIEVLSTKVDNDEEFIILIARRTKSLTIENYPSANCYKSSEQIS